MSWRHFRQRLPLILALLALVGVASAYIFGMSFAQSWQFENVRALDLVTARTIDVLIVSWCIWVGTSIGSFLNVVAWRMPRGQTINGRSICPRCRVQLRARDNFPVLGWLALGGRCRTCRLPISARYPLVESLVGLSITIVAASELLHFNLPFEPAGRHRGLLWNSMVDHSVFALMAYHVVGLSVSWAQGLIRMDGNRLPTKLVCFGLAAAIVPMLIYPKLMVVPWQVHVPDSWRPDGLYIDAIIRVTTALVTAIFLSRTLARSVCPTADPKVNPLGKDTARLIDLIAILAVPILVVGWQSSLAITVIASIIAIFLQGLMPSVDGLGRFAISMPVALTIQITVWKWTCEFAYWPSAGTAPSVFLAWGLAALVIPWWLSERSGAES